MGSSVESISSDAMAAVQMVRHRVEICLIWNRMMKGSIEHRDLRHSTAKQLARRRDPFEIIRIVQRRQVDAFLYALDHSLIDQRRFLEQLTAVYDSMTHGLYVTRTLD